VLTTLAALSGYTRSPSTSLILSEICAPRSVAARSMESAVLAALERLHAQGRVSYVSHRGTRHWQLTRSTPDETPASVGNGATPAAGAGSQ
jgi:hypothetical protein